MTKYYISLDSKNLSSHFANGYIAPQKYQKDARGDSSAHNDSQSIYAEHLLVTNFLYTESTNCALEIVFTEEEKEELIKIGNDNISLFLFEKSLPLSRVKQVNFKDAEQLKRTIANINNGSAFVRDSLLTVQNEEPVAVNDILERSKANGKIEVNMVSNEDMLTRYSRMLSAFSLMRVVTPLDSDYPIEYIQLFSQVSSQVESHESSIKVNIHDEIALHKLLTLTQSIAEGKDIPTNTAGLYDLEKIQNDQLFLKAFLLKYGNGSNARQKIDDFIDHVVNQKKGLKKLVPTHAFYLGYREKYSSLRNKYNIGGKEIYVKFKLDSKFDYYLLESLYQLVFNDIKKSGEFTYLDYWVPEVDNIDSFENYESQLVLGKLIKGKKKQTPHELLQHFYPNFLQGFSKIYNVIYLSSTAEMDQSDEKANERIDFFTRKLEIHFVELLNNFTQRVNDKLQEDCNEKLSKNDTEITELKRKLAEKESDIKVLEKKLSEREQKNSYKILEESKGTRNNASTAPSNIPETSTEEDVSLNKYDQVEVSQDQDYADMEQSTLHKQPPEKNITSNQVRNNEATSLLSLLGEIYTGENRRKKLIKEKNSLLKACINELQKSNPTLNAIDKSNTKKNQLIDYIVNAFDILDYKKELSN